eukprot:COSAG01_NODE_18152_length_1097_cov_1.051102_1_plen_33_part_10
MRVTAHVVLAAVTVTAGVQDESRGRLRMRAGQL